MRAIRRRAPVAAFLVAASLAAAMATPALAAAPDQDERSRTLVVTGRATVFGRPDTVRVTIGIDTQAPSAQHAQDENAGKVNRVLAALQDFGIAARDMQTSGIQLGPVFRYDEKSREQRLVGYRASYTLTVHLRKLEDAGQVVDAAVQAGANRIDGISFIVRDIQPLKQQALGQAVADAIAQAQALAQAAGIQLGELVSISGVSFTSSVPPIRIQMGARAPALEDTSTPVEPGELEFTASVTVTYAIR
ncbi:MAG: SIMPL domain-containing protein [Bacillota bacterium]